MSVEMISAWGEPTGKHAEIIRTEQGYEVNIFKGNEYLSTSSCTSTAKVMLKRWQKTGRLV